eukprot:TRINITY_DN12362_c0_g1_i1.p1 TRINITY_DN12362_c0_g1~~TRINITY_DN12362_c0_g1_i1.p1  ORF type:complete len:314 (-),score=68.20 TRINITY_DN12362_c0_g1_i1:171-974(-)
MQEEEASAGKRKRSTVFNRALKRGLSGAAATQSGGDESAAVRTTTPVSHQTVGNKVSAHLHARDQSTVDGVAPRMQQAAAVMEHPRQREHNAHSRSIASTIEVPPRVAESATAFVDSVGAICHAKDECIAATLPQREPSTATESVHRSVKDNVAMCRGSSASASRRPTLANGVAVIPTTEVSRCEIDRVVVHTDGRNGKTNDTLSTLLPPSPCVGSRETPASCANTPVKPSPESQEITPPPVKRARVKALLQSLRAAEAAAIAEEKI